MTDKRQLAATFLILLPGVWTLAAAVPTSFYFGWTYDRRLFEIYLPGLLIAGWLSDKTGEWYGQSFAVALQDGVIAVCVAFAAALLLARSQRWQARRWLRSIAVLISLTLPWSVVFHGFASPGAFRAAGLTLATGYVGCAMAGSVLPVSGQLRAALLAIALAIGVFLAVWEVHPLGWAHAGGLLSALVLLVMCIAQALRHGTEPQNKAMKLTKRWS